MNEPRHFLTLSDLRRVEIEGLFTRSKELKHGAPDLARQSLRGRNLVMLFEKSSTRTRVAFEIAMLSLGGNAVFLTREDSQLGRGEPLADTARVLSGMADVLAMRTSSHERVESLAKYSAIPVINALSDLHHPCQLLADLFTFQELRGSISGSKVAWLGDGNNMCNSYVEAANIFDFTFHIACPPTHEPDLGANDRSRVTISRDPKAAVTDSDLVVTDTWVSMGDEIEKEMRMKVFSSYQVNEELMKSANKDALFMHCLPAHRGMEVSASVLEGEQSVVWREAENRLHTQKALLEFLLSC